MELSALRADKTCWSLLAFTPTGEGESWEDENFRARFGATISLQYDLRPEDTELLRYIFEQETLYHEQSPYQGLTETLQVAGWLLAQQSQLDNMAHFIRAKFSNFDTNCGFSIMHVFSAGYDKTIAHLQELALAESVEEEILQRYDLSQEMVDQWFEEQRGKYPSSPEQETLETQVRRYVLLGEVQKASEALSKWESEGENTAEKLSTFRYWRCKLGHRGRAMELCHEILKLEVPEWLRASETLTLVSLLREESRTNEAWNVLVDYVEALEQDPAKAESRLTFQLLSEVWDLALAVGPGMPQVFEFGCELHEGLVHVPPVVLEKGIRVAMLYGDQELAARWEAEFRSE